MTIEQTGADPSPPPYPDDTLSKGWRFEIHTEKVKKSDTWLRARTGFVRAHLLLLWSESWEQTPCGTLPNDDELIALLLDMDLETFLKNRSILMRGWSLASNGRYYHETITDRVLVMLDKRMKDAQRSASARERAKDKQVSGSVVPRASRVTLDDITREFDTKHQAPSTSTSFKDSVPIGTGGEPPVDGSPGKPLAKPKTAAEIELADLWFDLKSLLVEQGTCATTKDAGTLVGKQVKKYGQDVFVDAARQTMAKKPVDVLTFLVGLCEVAAGKRQSLARAGTSGNLEAMTYDGGGDDFRTN